MIVTGKRHDFRIDYRVGFDGDGRIQGVEFDQAGNLLQREAGGLRRANEAKAFHICTAILADAT